MAAIESKRSERKKAISNQQLAISQSKTKGNTKTPTSTKTQIKTAVSTRKPRLPALPKPVANKREKTGRYRWGRNFYRFEGLKGKVVDFIEFFTMGEYHSIDLRFNDKTMLHFVIEPGFTLETDYSSIKTGNWHCLKRWPLVRSRGFDG